jgi:hypothetical protein
LAKIKNTMPKAISVQRIKPSLGSKSSIKKFEKLKNLKMSKLKNTASSALYFGCSKN